MNFGARLFATRIAPINWSNLRCRRASHGSRISSRNRCGKKPVVISSDIFSTDVADPVVVRKREDSTALMATLLGQHVGEAFQLPEDDKVRAASHFAVGGVRQALSAWLAGQVALTPAELVDHLAWTIDRLRPRR